MKLSKYIGKYDFIDYFSKQKSFWFFSNSEILASILTESKKISLDIVDELDLEDESDDSEELFDAYEYYKEMKNELKDVDKNDPRIFEGIIIDKKSKKYVMDEYPDIKKIYDFDSTEYLKKSLEELSEITKDIILNNDKVILFQPVFIHGDIITKPDAIVIDDGELKLIETKCTTTAKRHHFLDVFFQYQVLSRLEYLEDYIFDINLCLVRYNKANRREVDMILTDSFNVQSSINVKTNDIDIKQNVKIGQGFVSKNKEEMNYTVAPIRLVKLCEGNFIDLENRMDLVKMKKSYEEAQERIISMQSNFDSIIQELKQWKEKLISEKIDFISEIKPSPNEKSYWKKSDLFPKLRDIYAGQGYDLFLYSGNIVKQTANEIETFKKGDDLKPYFKNDIYYDYFIESRKEIIINEASLIKNWRNLKNKKVYFDFETINSPIRPIDNCLPFMQILTQCSVIVDDGSKKVKDLVCNNIVIDPIDIKISDFKNIIDALYHGEDFSYIVYNKSFEMSRLKEMAEFINEQEYYDKVNCINGNIHDLADYFKVNTKNKDCPVIIKQLHGFYSIKKVLPFVMKERRDIFDETGCVDYHDLDVVQNGLICQTETTKRFHNILDDDEWQKLVVNLKKYCENDVRAMVAVEYYIKTFI